MRLPFAKKDVDIVQYHSDKKVGRGGLIMLLLLLSFVFANVWNGYADKQNEYNDVSKSAAFHLIINALDLYYQDTSHFLEQRYYPRARCSNELNSFDYEYTLRGELTGIKTQATSHRYMDQFPTDQQGKYTVQFDKNFQCKEALATIEQAQLKYLNGSQSCRFDINSSRNCFLYTSSLTGDNYKLAYWSPHYKKFVVYSKFRTQEVQISLY